MKKYMLLFALMFLLSICFVAGESSFSTTRETLLNQDPDPAEPGKYVELRWKVEKIGSEAIGNTTYMIEPNYPFSLDEDSQGVKSIGTWYGYSGQEEYYTLYFKLRVADDAIEDDYPVKLKVKHDSDYWVTTEYQIHVGDRKEANFVLGTLTTSPTKLVSDTDEVEINVNIENIGDGSAEMVRSELNLPKGFNPTYSYSDRKNVGTIDAGEGKSATFYVDIDDNVPAGDYQANLVISYTEENDEDNEYQTVTLPLSLQVKDKPRFKIEKVESTPEKIFPGGEVEIKLLIKNMGGKTGESVSIRAFKESSQPFSFDEKSDYIGNLESGESGEAVIRLSIDKDATPKNYLIDVEFRTIDNGEVIVDDDTIKLEISDPKSKENAKFTQVEGTLFIVGIIGAALFIVFGFYLGKKSASK